jgi:hypothetical protein
LLGDSSAGVGVLGCEVLVGDVACDTRAFLRGGIFAALLDDMDVLQLRDGMPHATRYRELRALGIIFGPTIRSSARRSRPGKPISTLMLIKDLRIHLIDRKLRST